MANKMLFRSIAGKLPANTDTRNEAGAPAYALSPRHALAQYAATGCLNSTYYADAGHQLAAVLRLCKNIEPEFVARTAVYCRKSSHMKDMPALLCAILSIKEPDLLPVVFNKVIDNGKMLRNFVQIMRSGVVGRKSLGSRPKRLIQKWLSARSDEALFSDTVGKDPSLADIIKMVHPRPVDNRREAFYGYLIGREVDREQLPEVANNYERFMHDRTGPLPKVAFQKLTALDLTTEHWKEIARTAPWQMTRMNLNTFMRHGVFEDAGLVEVVAKRLCNPALIARARVMPYQLMIAWRTVHPEMPWEIKQALRDALELAMKNVPEIEGGVHVLVDVSGSMSSSITGYRRGATSKVACVDVAALIAACILHKNPLMTQVLAFDTDVYDPGLHPEHDILESAAKLAGYGGGATDCSAPLMHLNNRRSSGDLVVYISDNQSWVDASYGVTETVRQWQIFKMRNPGAKMICVDIQPYGNSQAPESGDILNVGGFSDAVFKLIGLFARDEINAGHWVAEIEKIKLKD